MMKILSSFRILGPATLLSCAASVGLAADLAPSTPAGWAVTVGLGPEALPSFPGARTYRVWPTGTIAWRGPDEPPPFTTPDDGFGIAILNLGWIKAGPVARFVPRRGLSDGNGNFYGLHNIPLTAELGGFTELWLAPFLRTRLELRNGINGAQGLDANVSIDGVARFGAFTFSIGPRMALGDTQFMNAYFSVTPAEAAANGRVTPYQATGGVTSYGGLTALKYDLSPAWSVTTFGGYQRLVNSAAASPIPNRLGSNNQFSAGAVLAYTFSFDHL